MLRGMMPGSIPFPPPIPDEMVAKTALDAPLLALLAASVGLKLLLIPSYTSTDFEVHRNWLSLTHALPARQWYHEATSEWTLDYPPFFALFEYALATVGARLGLGPEMLRISATPVFSPSILLFQRLSVILSDAVLFYAICAYCASWPSVTTTEPAFSRYKRLVVALVTSLDAGLLFVDHIHFQYNGMLLGLLILSVTKLRLQQDLQGALLYAVLLMMKHIYLYVAPLYFAYLLGHHCYVKTPTPSDSIAQQGPAAVSTSSSTTASLSPPKPRKVLRKRSISDTDGHETVQDLLDGKASFSLFNFLRLGLLVLFVFAVAFGFVLVQHEDPLEGMKQILSRLFPVQRGLCHAYWAPNVWALYAFLDKVLVLVGFSGAKSGVALMSGGLVQEANFAILPSVPPLVCAALAFGMMLPVLYSVWKYPDPSLFMSALVYCMLCSFLFGYHVHEKAILQVILPLGLMAADSVNDMRLYRFASIISTISLFPLLFTPAEQGTKVLLAAIHALLAYVSLIPFHRWSLKERHIKATAVGMSKFEVAYLFGLTVVTCLAFAFPYIPRVGAKYSFLPLMLISVSCAVGNLYVWGLAVTQHFRKLGAVKSYINAKRIAR
jgi:alpha-1,3-glucosyltransferase